MLEFNPFVEFKIRYKMSKYRNLSLRELRSILDFQPTEMTEEDIANAQFDFDYFFHHYELHESRKKIWELYEGWVHLEAESPQGESMKEMLFFCRLLIGFLNCAFVVNNDLK